jgi:hypothetical protein
MIIKLFRDKEGKEAAYYHDIDENPFTSSNMTQFWQDITIKLLEDKNE